MFFFFFFQAEDGIRDIGVTGVQTCALPISRRWKVMLAGLRWFLWCRSRGLGWREPAGRYLVAQGSGRGARLGTKMPGERLPESFVLRQRFCLSLGEGVKAHQPCLHLLVGRIIR